MGGLKIDSIYCVAYLRLPVIHHLCMHQQGDPVAPQGWQCSLNVAVQDIGKAFDACQQHSLVCCHTNLNMQFSTNNSMLYDIGKAFDACQQHSLVCCHTKP